MKNPTYNRSIVEKFNIKGQLSNDGAEIEFINTDRETEVKSVLNMLKPFFGEFVEITVSTKTMQDLEDDSEEE